MKLSELAIIFGIFVLIFYSGIAFLSSFQIQANLPPEIEQAFNQTYQNILKAESTVSSGVSQSTGGGFDVLNVFQKAFGGIFYIVLSLYSVFISTPQAVFGGINYLAGKFGVPSYITQIVIAILTTVIILQVIKFVTGREM